MPWQEDPAYQAYMGALGFDEGIARADAAQRQTQVNATADLQVPEVQRQGELQRTGINDSYEDRGLYRGSERLGALADQRAGQQFDLASIEMGRANALSEAEMALARELAGVNRGRLNLGIQYANQYANDLPPSATDPASAPVDPMQLVRIGRLTQLPSLF